MAMAGHEYKGGKAVRLTDIPVDDDAGNRSIFTDTHGKTPKQFGWDLKAACAELYGLAGPAFVVSQIAEAMQKEWLPYCDMLRAELKFIEDTLAKHISRSLPPEGQRVVTRFCLVALAGMRATRAGIWDWTVTEILSAVVMVLNRWLVNLGDAHSEQERALAKLRDQLLRNESRFVWLNAEQSVMEDEKIVRFGGSARMQARDVIGYKLKDQLGLTNMGFDEMCGEFDSRMVKNALKTRGYLICDEGKLTRKWPTIPGWERRPYLITINLEFLGESESESPAKAGLPF
jgi:hypothetical protein